MKKTAKKTQQKKYAADNPLFFSPHDKAQQYLAVDLHNAPLAIMPLPAILEQRLFHRKTLVVLLSKENHLILCKQHPHSKQEKWGLPADAVKAHEACEDTAIRLIQAITLPPEDLYRVCTNRYHAFDNSFRSVYLARMPKQFQLFAHLPPETFWLTDEDEFLGLAADTPEVFSEEVLWAVPFLEELFKKIRIKKDRPKTDLIPAKQEFPLE